MDGTAAVGTSAKYAREDHVHPTDTSRASTIDVTAQGNRITALESENALLRELLQGIDAPVYREESGNPATFSDGYPANVKALSVTLTPTQSGSGDPYPPGGGPNFMARESGTVWTSGTTNELTFTQTDNGILINGISGAGSSPSFVALRTTLEAGTYTLTGTPGITSTDSVVVVYHAGTNATLALAFADNVTFQLSEQTEVYVRVFAYGNHGTYSNFLVTCMLVRGTAAPSGYMPFANIRLISGATSVTVTRTGENGANAQSVTVALVDSNNDPLTVYGGTLNVTTGELTATHKLIDLSTVPIRAYTVYANSAAFAVSDMQIGTRWADGACSHAHISTKGNDNGSGAMWLGIANNSVYSHPT